MKRCPDGHKCLKGECPGDHSWDPLNRWLALLAERDEPMTATPPALPSGTDLDVASNLLFKVANGAMFGPTSRNLARRLAYHLVGQKEPTDD